MRLIDIYKETADGVKLVTAGCIQTGSTDLTKTVQSKFYTMADGTACCYPVQTAKSSMTLELECTQTQAAAIEHAASLGSLLFAGLRFGTNYGTSYGADQQPFPTGYRAFLTGNVQIAEKFALTGIYSVTLPLLLDASGGSYLAPAVPALNPTLLYLNGVQMPLSRFGMELRTLGGMRLPVLTREATLFISSDSIGVDLRLTRTNSLDTEGLTAFLTKSTDTAVTTDGISAQITGTVQLDRGDNLVYIRCALNGCRELIVCIPVYRQAVSA